MTLLHYTLKYILNGNATIYFTVYTEWEALMLNYTVQMRKRLNGYEGGGSILDLWERDSTMS